MDTLIESIEDRLFTAQDTVCLDRARLATEAYAEQEGKPGPLLRAAAFRHILRHMTLDLRSNPVFAGNTSSALRAWMLVPEFGLSVNSQIAIEHSELEGFLEGKIPEEIRSFWKEREFGGIAGVGHMSLDFDLVVNRGLIDVLERIGENRSSGPPESRVYREAMAISCEAVIEWAGRFSAEAERAAAESDDPLEISCLNRVAEACRRVPARPARDLFEGLQAIALVHLASVLEGQGLSMSIGLPDRALARFGPEVEQNPEQAVALVRAFLLKIASNSFQGRGSKTQPITVGGAHLRGDVCNAVTHAFLDAFDRTPVSDPHLFVRWHNGLDQSVWDKGLAMLSRGRSMPLLINDHQVVPGLIEAGVAPEDAWDYCIVGCNELGIPGRCCQSGFSEGTGFDDLKVLDQILRSSNEEKVSTVTILDGYEQRVRELVMQGVASRRASLDEMVDRVPFPFCSACCRSCVESGQDLLHGMPYTDIYGLFIRGTANAVNALAAFEHLTVEEGPYTLSELIEGVDAGDADVLSAIGGAPKWGNDDDRADRFGLELNARRDRALREVAAECDIPPFAVCHVVRSLHFLDGQSIPATLDGREAGSPVGDSVGAVLGTQGEGPTAMLNSVLKLDAARWFSGIYNLNLTLPGGPQSDLKVIRPLAEAFFREGDQELQISVLDATTLREAQRDPDSYRDLVVRVAGLNARFVELSALEQEQLIHRAEAASGEASKL
ncbi:MAG: pyruvate formate lyase family protein [Candidatus Latescibacteria bacterium]|nr:pyruvate formate lyase family protein [Candidatus Latescibacterota bacterium]